MKKYLILILILLPLTCLAEPRLRPNTWAVPVIETHLQNLFLVDNQIYRSEQPKKEDVRDLKLLGIKEVLNLREFHSDEDDLSSSNFELHHVKMHTSKITEEEIVESLKYIKNRKGPILIHCWHGSDRTGVTIALYRIMFNNWTKEQAVDEMVNGGYGYHARVYPELVTLIENSDIEEIKRRINK